MYLSYLHTYCTGCRPEPCLVTIYLARVSCMLMDPLTAGWMCSHVLIFSAILVNMFTSLTLLSGIMSYSLYLSCFDKESSHTVRCLPYGHCHPQAHSPYLQATNTFLTLSCNSCTYRQYKSLALCPSYH